MSITIALLVVSSILAFYMLVPVESRGTIRSQLGKIQTSFLKALSFETWNALPQRTPMATDLQENCPFFTLIPGEIRDRIFQYAVTDHAVEKKEYEKNAHYYRPEYRFEDQKLDTNLLRTCRRIYEETKHLPSENYVQVEWCRRAPPNKANTGRSVFTYSCPVLEHVKSLHLFTQQYWLEDWSSYTTRIAKKMPNLRYIKITLRHGDWWYWEHSEPLKFDPKQEGKADLKRLTKATDPFAKRSWGNYFRSFPNLKMLELELESIEGKRTELDEIVRRAPGWRFPLNETHNLILNPQLTTRTGRIGMKLPDGDHVPRDPFEAKSVLIKDGVDFRMSDPEMEKTASAEESLTYYTVTLFYEKRSKASVDL